MDIDTLIHADWIIPVEPQDLVLEQHSIAIHQGRIVALLPQAEARTQLHAETTLNLAGHALIPGLVNAHTHAAMTLLRGLADDLPLMTWLTKHIWPAEAQWINPTFVQDGTQLALLEMLRSGTTCFNDMYFFPDVTAHAAIAAGLRASIGLIVIDFPSAWAQDAETYLSKGLALHSALQMHPRIKLALAPHAPYSVADAPLKRIAHLAAALDLPVHIHVHETRAEITNSLRDHSCRPLNRLSKLGLVSSRLQAVHMTQLDDSEIEHLARCAAQVIHCPESNLKLASGTCPVPQLLAAGVNCALGTDGAASNNDLDLLGEMRTAALLAKGTSGNAATLPAAQVLRMATLQGARALGWEREIGSLEVGKAADIVAIDLSLPETQPLYHPVSQIVYAASRDQVRHVWVAGQWLLRDRQPFTLDASAILQRAQDWGQRIRTHAAMAVD